MAPTNGLVAVMFGTRYLGMLGGIVFFSHQIGSFVGAFLGGELVDATDSYLAMWWIGVGLGVIAMVFHLLIDESPVPEPPAPGEGGLPLVPAGVGVTMAAIGIASRYSKPSRYTMRAASDFAMIHFR